MGGLHRAAVRTALTTQPRNAPSWRAARTGRHANARIGQLTTVADIQRITQDVLRRMRTLQMTEKLEVRVTFDPAKGYVGTAAGLRSPVTALSLGGLRRKIEALLMPDEVIDVLQLDRAARRERDRRREPAGRERTEPR